jgi:ABC-type lipoprotein export system ATPase subunit
MITWTARWADWALRARRSRAPRSSTRSSIEERNLLNFSLRLSRHCSEAFGCSESSQRRDPSVAAIATLVRYSHFVARLFAAHGKHWGLLPVKISRIQVTGGFLNGLDLELTDGLNVIVGPRGSGKTTLLELLRHALGAPRANDIQSRERQQFLTAVLGTGDVIVDIETPGGSRHLVVDAKGGGRNTDLTHSVLALGQNELEEIASSAPARLNLIDLRMGVTLPAPSRSEAPPLTIALYNLRAQLEVLREETKIRDRLTQDRSLLSSQESALIEGGSAKLAENREQLRVAEEIILQSDQDMANVDATLEYVKENAEAQEQQTYELQALASRVATLPNSVDVQARVNEAVQTSSAIIRILGEVESALLESIEHSRLLNIEARTTAAPIRQELEEAEAGLGSITSQIRAIDFELLKIDEVDAEIARTESRIEDTLRRRAQILDQAEILEEELYATRAEVAGLTTSLTANNVVVTVDHLADSTQFREFLIESLYGSKTRASMIDMVAQRVLPRQLLEIVENHDEDSLVAITNIARDRAQRLIENLDRSEILGGLSEVSLSDSADFQLRDGDIEKSVDLLSTGQKCAVTLPIVLSEQERTLILDQPEDHLDNAYLVENVVGGLMTRQRNGAQTIIATHNPNIPVLGSAENVVVLASDGSTGRVDRNGAFDELPIVQTITTLMEGGRDAFARRYEFYSEHGGLS